MIAYLSGQVKALVQGKAILNCQGVGYLVSLPSKTLSQLKPDQVLEVFTHTYVKEDVLSLFGFTDLSQLQLFEQLISVSGIGPKTGLNIFNAGSPQEITAALKEGSVEFFTKVPGIGKKNAQRLIVELKNKLGGDQNNLNYLADPDPQLTDALASLGFTKKEIIPIIQQIDQGLPLSDKIRTGLKLLHSQ